MIIWYTGAAATGAVFGFMFFGLYRKIIPAGFTKSYLNRLAKNTIGLLRDDIKSFWHYYGDLITCSLRYSVWQIIGVSIAVLPMLVIILLWSTHLELLWNKDAKIAIVLKASGKSNAASTLHSLPTESPTDIAIGLIQSGYDQTILSKEWYRHFLESPRNKYAIFESDSILYPILKTLGFRVYSDTPAGFKQVEHFILRPTHNDINPFWPYLGDIESLFFLSVSIALLYRMMTEKKDKVNIDSYDMSYVDYILSGLATQFSGLLSSSGNIESWFFATKLKQIEIQKPVFITGLARAGTTILLQTLSNVEGVATHRYRDFPFIMTPIIWNRFVSLFSKQQVPIQRPHKDRIEITRESPDAFEEPIWQFFFPFVHNTDSSHVLDESLSNPQFEKFFTDHLKKIVMIRKGTRYVSKGNYNLTRIPYISKLFSDSKFVIPIRHPLAHVDSLVRQHKLFNDYSGQNKNIPEYLKSVGHYEFGPQRRPIHVSAEGARRIADAWSHGEDARGYAIQWAELYGFLYQLQRSVTCLADRILTIRYEDFCGEPELAITRILTFCEFDTQLPEGVDVAAIKPPSRKIALSEIDMNRCWDEVESVAHLYGYRRSCFTNTINN